jgi:SAM-dependent methyltransferase
MKYCRGQGLDLGCGLSKIRSDAIGIDLNHPTADMNADARNLDCYPSGHFDYVFSSHLLEEIENTEATLREWLRILKPGGNLVLYQADRDLYYPFGDPRCNQSHRHHFKKEELWAVLEKIGSSKLLHMQDPVDPEWSFELVVQKIGGKIPNMNRVGISLLIPVRNYASLNNVLLSINNTLSDPSAVEILLGIVPQETWNVEKIKSLYKMAVQAFEITNPNDLISSWKQLINRATKPIIGYLSDNFLSWTPRWDEEIEKQMDQDKSNRIIVNDVHRKRQFFFLHRSVDIELTERDFNWNIPQNSLYREDLIFQST